MANVGSTAAALEMHDVRAMAGTLSLEVATSELRRPEDIASAFEALKGRADALYVVIDPLVSTNRETSGRKAGARLFDGLADF